MVDWRKVNFKKMFVTLVFGTLVAALVVVISSKQVLAADSLRKLNLQDVAQLILKNSLKKEESNLTYQSTLIKPTQVLSGLDYTLSVETGWEQSRFENFTGTANPKDETYKTTVQLKKSFLTGTTLLAEYNRTSLRSEFSQTYTGTLPNSQTQDVAGISFEQSILKNGFGQNTRRDIQAADFDVSMAKKNRLLQLQDQVLEGVRAFWQAYVAQKNFQEAISTKDRYQKLVESVRKKNQFGYANPGELYQVLAELEIREQSIKAESQNYLDALDHLLTLLNLPKDEKINLEIPEGLTPLPHFSQLDLLKNRNLQMQKEKLDQAQLLLDSADNKTLPDLSLVAKVYQSGLEPRSEDSITEMTGGNHPKYYLGVKLSYSFGSNQQAEEFKNKNILKSIEEVRWQKSKADLLKKESNIQRKIQVSYHSVISFKNQLEFRDKALQDIQKAYTQGRMDISVLIDAMNKYFAVQTQYTKGLGDYQMALNEWAALSDELISDQVD